MTLDNRSSSPVPMPPELCGAEKSCSTEAVDAERLIDAAVGITMVQYVLPHADALNLVLGGRRHHRRRREALVRELTESHVPAVGVFESTDGPCLASQVIGAQDAADREVARRGAGTQTLDDSVPARLFDLLVVTTDPALLLGAVAELAAETISGCAWASVTVVGRNGPTTLGSSDQRARSIDEAQYAAGRGPCVDAAYGDIVVQVDDVRAVSAGQIWPREAVAAGVTAIRCVPIMSAAHIVAVLNLYTTTAGGWPPMTQVAADALASYAGDTLTVAYRMTRSSPERHCWRYLS